MANNVYIRKPRISISFMTEADNYTLNYDENNTDKNVIGELSEAEDMEIFGENGNPEIQSTLVQDAIINLATENDMSKDTGTFAITLVGTRRWDVALSANDLVVIRIHPSITEVKNDVVMVGLISRVEKIGEYSSNSVVYSITGLSLGKALMQMKIGTIQELATVYTAGWLNSLNKEVEQEGGVSEGINFSNSTASGIVQQIISYFLLGYSKYSYNAGKGQAEKMLRDFIELKLSSRADEKMTNVTPYMSYMGSLRQFITKMQAKPFNEFYSDFTSDGKCRFVMRPTPFEQEDWENLGKVMVPTSDVVEENVSRDDTDAYSIFNCSAPNDLFGQSGVLISKPQYSQELVDKYGYSILEEENPYIFRTADATSSGSLSGSAIALEGSGGSLGEGTMEEIRQASLAYTHKATGDATFAGYINDYVKAKKPSSMFATMGQDFMDASTKSGLNPVYILCHACLESAWGTSSMSYNFFGIGAFDNNPTNGHKYGNNTPRDGIINGAVWISENFYQAGQTTLYTMRHNNGKHEYATDPEWDIKIATQMANFYSWVKTNKKVDLLGTKAVTEDEASKSLEIIRKDTETDADQDNTENIDSTTEKEKKEKKKEEEATASYNNSARLGIYSKYLFNWYADNPEYYSGSIRIVGNPDVRVGNVLRIKDPDSLIYWEYYIEAVSHDFSYTGGYTTVIGVTRGLKTTQDRFKHHYTSEDFLGGLFGEMTLTEMMEEASTETANPDSDTASGSTASGSTYNVKYESGWQTTVYVPSLGGINSQGDPTVTATGTKVKDFKTCAVDPTVVPYGSILAVKVPNRPDLTRLWHAEDTGGAIKGKHLDLCVSEEYYKKNSVNTKKAEVAIVSRGTNAQTARDNENKLDSLFQAIDDKSLVKTTSSNNKVVEFANKWCKPNHPSLYLLGGYHGSTNPFVSGAGTLKIDCSAFTGWMMYNLGAKGWSKSTAPQDSRSQGNGSWEALKTIHPTIGRGASASAKKKVLDNSEPGDLVFFCATGSRITHVAVYVGKENGKHMMIGATGKQLTANSGIKKDPIDESYWLTRFNGLVRRIQF